MDADNKKSTDTYKGKRSDIPQAEWNLLIQAVSEMKAFGIASGDRKKENQAKRA